MEKTAISGYKFPNKYIQEKNCSPEHTYLQREACKETNLQREACKICSAELAEISGTTIYWANSSEVGSVTNPRATWAPIQAAEDVSSGLGGRLGLLEDCERQRRWPCVLRGSLGSLSLLLEAAVAQLLVLRFTALNIRGVRGLLLLGPGPAGPAVAEVVAGGPDAVSAARAIRWALSSVVRRALDHLISIPRSGREAGPGNCSASAQS